MNLSHHKLVSIGHKWLFKTHPIVLTEVATVGEEPDVIGFKGGASTLIECKASRADFLADRAKEFRKHPQIGIGEYRYNLTPVDLLDLNELPDRWGLLETDGKRVFRRRIASSFTQFNESQEKRILLSIIRRIALGLDNAVSISPYTYDTKNRATLTIDVDDDTIEISDSDSSSDLSTEKKCDL